MKEAANLRGAYFLPSRLARCCNVFGWPFLGYINIYGYEKKEEGHGDGYTLGKESASQLLKRDL